jgi:hypothetical protein
MISQRARLLFAGVGFFAGPAAWAVHQQIGYMLVPVSCQSRVMWVPILTLLAIAVTLAGGYVSWMPWRRSDEVEAASDAMRAHRFLAVLSALFALLFALAILLQGAATLFMSGCQR